ncbi:MAG: hypothetical protein HOL17_15125 [Gammaproteobacteria bacterium]|nr:hypothetical protein [Gammaproteobacteria bacterium]
MTEIYNFFKSIIYCMRTIIADTVKRGLLLFACLSSFIVADAVAGFTESVDVFDAMRGEKGQTLSKQLPPKKGNIAKKETGFNLKNVRLVGTACNQDQCRVLIEEQGSGIVQKLQWRKGESVLIGENQVAIVAVQPRKIRVRFLKSGRCKRSLPKIGIRCMGTEAELTLISQKAVPSKKQKQQRKVAPKIEKKIDKISEEKEKTYKGNPIPLGKKLVKTPFGDMLVDDN